MPPDARASVVDQRLPWMTFTVIVSDSNERPSQAQAGVGACGSNSGLRSSMSFVFIRGPLHDLLPFPSLKAAIKCHSFFFVVVFELAPICFLGTPDLCQMQVMVCLGMCTS